MILKSSILIIKKERLYFLDSNTLSYIAEKLDDIP